MSAPVLHLPWTARGREARRNEAEWRAAFGVVHTFRGRLCRRVASRWLLHHGAQHRRGRAGRYLWNLGCHIDDRKARP